MGYLMRFISTDERPITLAMVEVALKQVDKAYAITNVEINDMGDFLHGDVRCAVIEINRPGDDIFDDDIEAFQQMMRGDSIVERRIIDVLGNAKSMIVVEAFWEGLSAEPVLEKIDPLWHWLFENYAGLSQADGEGFYDRSGLILERKYTL